MKYTLVFALTHSHFTHTPIIYVLRVLLILLVAITEQICLGFFLDPQVQKLQAILKPMMLRRLKEDVEKNLAPKQETIIEVSVNRAHLM